jgi:diguanylate cyclase (GGDEF)-like protein/PAS domain S-box-containing protein
VNSIQVLLVENQQSHVDMIQRAFDRFSNRYVLRHVGSLSEARSYLKQIKPGLIIVDLSLPDGQGTELLTEAEQGYSDCPIIILTNQRDEEAAVEAIKAGALDYIVKTPDKLTNLPNAAEHVLREWQHICARREVETQLRFQAEILDSVRESVIVTDLEGNVIYWSKGAESLYGYPEEEVMGKPLTFIVEPSETEQENERLRQVRESGSWNGQHKHIRKDGSSFWGDTFISLATDENGQPFGMISIDRDITHRVNTEEALREANQELTLVVRTLQRRNRQITLLNEMGDLLQSCLSVNDAYAVLGEFADKLFPDISGAMYTLSPSKNLLEVVSVWGKNPPELQVFETNSCWAMRRARTHSVLNFQTRVKCQHVPSSDTQEIFSPYLCSPMTAHGESLGLLHLIAPPNEDISEWEQLSTTISERAALAISNLKLREELRLQSILDPLTGLFNRRYFEKTLERELSRANRHDHPVGVFMLDVDDLKGYNDQYGHGVGDALLHEIGYYLKKHVRGEDVACRYGGDEFTIILPDASSSSAIRRAEELCAGISDLRILYQDQKLGGNSISIGVASFPTHGRNVEQLVKAADQALYAAKEAGRNCVRIAE